MTTLVTSAGAVNVITAEVTELLEGAWTARVVLDTDAPIVGPVTLTEGLTTWAGVQKRGAQEHGRTIAQLVGGTGGLSNVLPVMNYNAPFFADILSDLMRDTLEVLSPTVDAALLFAQTERWSRRAQTGGRSLKQITDASSADHWRIRRDGLVWLGTEAWPAVPATFRYVEISRDPADDTITIAPEDGQVLVAVGDNFLGRNVSGVWTTIAPGEVRQIISWESEGATGDRMLGPMKSIVEGFVGSKIDYCKMYPSVVNFQNGDGTLDLTPDDESVRGNGFKQIQISYGLPGVKATVPSGGRVNLYFQNGDPKQPRAALWEGSGVNVVTFGDGTESYMRTETFLVQLNTLVTALSAFATAAAAGRAGGGDATMAAACTAFTNAALQLTFKSTTIKGE